MTYVNILRLGIFFLRPESGDGCIKLLIKTARLLDMLSVAVSFVFALIQVITNDNIYFCSGVCSKVCCESCCQMLSVMIFFDFDCFLYVS